MATNNDDQNKRALLDNLFEEVRAFRYGKDIRALFNYCAKMQHLSAYNAALVYTQQPGNRLVLTAKKWLEEGRRIKPNSRPLIILLPFGPVGFVYDIGDTEPISGKDSDYERERLIQNYLVKPFEARQLGMFGCSNELDNLKYNLPFHGIKYEPMRAGSQLAANIKVHDGSMIEVPIRKKGELVPFKYTSHFWLGVNNKADTAEELCSLAHELGHLFCHHLYVDDRWWKQRKLEINSKEFEAESTAWLVCSRLGIDSRSIEYLSGYKDDDLIPPVSFESIFTAVSHVEHMIKGRMNHKDGLLYKKDKVFKEKADRFTDEQ